MPPATDWSPVHGAETSKMSSGSVCAAEHTKVSLRAPYGTADRSVDLLCTTVSRTDLPTLDSQTFLPPCPSHWPTGINSAWQIWWFLSFLPQTRQISVCSEHDPLTASVFRKHKPDVSMKYFVVYLLKLRNKRATNGHHHDFVWQNINSINTSP